MDAHPLKHQKPSLLSQIWSSFLAGIVVIAPMGITAAIVYWFVTGPITRLDTFVKNFLPAGDSTVETLTRAIPGFGGLVAILFIILLGAFAKNIVGRVFIQFGEDILDSVPVVRNLYRFFKNVFETALAQSERSFKEVALVEYPRPGAWVMGFVVGDSKGEIKERLTDMGEQLTSIFIPTVPNPTSGFLLFVPRDSLRPLAMTVEDAAKVVFSLGLVVPPYRDPTDARRALETAAQDASAAAPKKRGFFRRRGGKPRRKRKPEADVSTVKETTSAE